MYAIVRRLFYVPYEWRRLATAVFLAAALIAIWETLVPHDGADGLALTLALCAAFPAGLWAARFLTEEERERLGALFAGCEAARSFGARWTTARPRQRRLSSRPRETSTGASGTWRSASRACGFGRVVCAALALGGRGAGGRRRHRYRSRRLAANAPVADFACLRRLDLR